jgi:glycogen debranching enzyme
MIDPLALLERQDKWFLGAGPGLIYAPPAPIWLTSPGFWDAAHYLHYPVDPVFTFVLLDEQQRPIQLSAGERHWRPDRLIQQHHAAGLQLQETRTCGPQDVLGSAVRLSNTGAQQRQLTLLMWTAQPVTDETLEAAGFSGSALYIRRTVKGLRNTSMPLTLAFTLETARSYNLQLSETTVNQPHFHLTPYTETLQPHGLDNQVTLTGVNQTGLIYGALERTITLEPGASQDVTMAAAIAPTTDAAFSQVRTALSTHLPATSERVWRDFFAQVPEFSCSDPFITRYYWYRWYGLRLNLLNTQLGNYRYPAIAEGVDYFRVPISYSAQCHMLETRWLRTPSLAQGSLLNFVTNQRDDGSFPGHIHTHFVAEEGIYHADWGQRVLDVDVIHPDHAFLERVYPSLKRYVNYFYRERDPQGSGLYDHVNQWESGQEYMSRYVWVDAEGDEWKTMTRRLKGLDASIYIYRLERALAEISRRLGKGEEARWEARAERTKAAILRHCWDDNLQAFVDVSPELERSGLIFAISFYPFFTDIASEVHLPSLRRHLLNPEEFWTAYPVPASSKTDPYFSATPAWKGKRTNCPWNGRTWPMTNSHLVEALAHASTLDPTLRTSTAELLTKFIHMMFFDGDVSRPNCFEHYNPETGHASVYRGIDDYQHSWVVDLIIKYIVGLRPQANGVVIDPFPLNLTSFHLKGAYVRGRRFDIQFDGHDLAVELDGVRVQDSTLISWDTTLQMLEAE